MMETPEEFFDDRGDVIALRPGEAARPAAASAPRKPSRRFSLVRFDSIKVAAGAPYLVKGLIPREGLVVVWGPPKCGKTFWAFDLAMHIALGWEYRGRRVLAGTVVYIACEGERGLAARAEAFRLDKMGDATAEPSFYLLATRLGLATDAGALIGDIQG